MRVGGDGNEHRAPAGKNGFLNYVKTKISPQKAIASTCLHEFG